MSHHTVECLARSVSVLLVTGANGFAGSALCAQLSKSRYQVRQVIRCRKEDKLAQLAKSENAEVLTVGGIGPDTNWTSAIQNVDVVIHLAARVHVMRDTATYALGEFRRVNVAGTKRLAIAAAQAGVKRFVYLSSAKVVGESTNNHALSECDAPAPEEPYGISKWEAEQILHKVADETGLDVVIMRPPLVYGPRVKANFLTLMKLVDRGVPLPFGTVVNRRSLLYVGNLVDAIILCIEHPAAAGQTFLLSDGEDVSTPELIRRLAAALGRPSWLIPVPAALLNLAARTIGKADEISRLTGSLQVDSSRIRQALGWTPPFSIEQGLAETAAWYRGLTDR
jgi:nucleoside-diphosphate-sugar epimerase